MSKGAYDVNEPYVGPSKDASFRSCMCAMLVFISICGIILIVTTVMGTSSGKTKDYPDNTHAASRYGNKESNDNQKTTERINDDVETVEHQGVDSRTNSSSGKIRLTSTTTTIKPETTTLSQPTTLSTNKPKQATIIEGKETIDEQTIQTTQQKKDQKQKNDVVTENENSSVSNNSQNAEPTKQKTQETITENKDTTLEDNTKNKQVVVTGNQDKLTKDNPETTEENTNKTKTESKNTTLEDNSNNKQVVVTDNQDKLTKDSPETTEENTNKTKTESKNTTLEDNSNNKQVVVTGNQDKLTKDNPETTEENTNKTKTENKNTTLEDNSNNKQVVVTGNHDKLTKDSPETTEENTNKTKTESKEDNINSKQVVVTDNQDKLTTDNSETTEENTNKTKTESKEDNINSKQVVVTGNQDKLTTDYPETTEENTNKTITESTDTTLEDNINNKQVVITGNQDTLTTDSPKTTEENTNKTITESTDTTLEDNINNKQVVITGNQDKLTTDNPETTEENTYKTITESKEDNINSKQVVVTGNQDKLTTDNPETTEENTNKTITESTDTTLEDNINNKQVVVTGNQDKLTKDNPETTEENTYKTITESKEDNINSKQVVVTGNQDKLTTDSPETTEENTDKTITESTDTTLEDNINNKQVVATDNQDKLTTDSPETTEENTYKTTQQSEEQDRSFDSNPTQGNSTEDTDTTSQTQKNYVVTKNDEPTTQQTPETTPESEVIMEENIKNKQLVEIGNQDTLTTDNPETTTTSDIQQGTEEKKLSETEQSTIKPTDAVSTRQSTFKRLTPPPGVRTSTIVETDDTGHSSPDPVQNNNQPDDLCGAECKSIGARMLSRMNHSGDACEHFYDYACGGDNIDNTPEDNWKRIADGLHRINSQSPGVYKTFKRFYESCLDFHVDYDYNQRVDEATQTIMSVIETSVENIGDKSALTEMLTQLILLDSSPLFDISVDVDKENQTFVFQLNLGKQFSTFSDKYTSLTTRRKCLEKSKKSQEFSMSHFNAIDLNDMYKEYLDCKKTETYKLETVEKALEALEASSSLTVELGHIIPKIVDIIPKILDQIKGLLPSPAVVRNNITTRQFETRKVSEMELHYPSIEWKKLLSNLVGKEVGDEDKVQVYFKDFFKQLFGPKTTLSTAALHEAILGMYAHDLYTNYILPTPINNPEDFCLKHSSDLMKEVASSLFLESIDPKNTNDPKQIEIQGDLERIEDLFTKMKRQMLDLMNEASWVDHETRSSVTTKLNNMEFDSWNRSTIWRNISIVEGRMKGVEKEYDQYSNFTVALVKRNRKLLYSMWNTMAYKEENVWWHFITPYSTSPKSTYPINRVFVPPGALLTKSEKIPKYLSLVKLGFQLAKSIAHHFDYFGSRGFTRKTKQAYKDTKDCILDIYSKINGTEYDGKYLQVKVDADSFMLSLNDRYAEDLAITLLSKMLQDNRDDKITWFLDNEDFNSEKLFFIALGQEHCKKPRWEDFFVDFFEGEQFATPLLLDNSMAHSESFSEIFGCNDGSRMNPDPVVRCKSFPMNEEPDVVYYDYDN